MMKQHSFKILTAIALIATLAVASYAFAGWGRDWGHMGYGPHHREMMGDYGGYGPGPGEYGPRYGQGRGFGSNLSQEQIEKMETQREAFFKETEPIRQRLYEKEMALRNELAKENSDADAAKALQKEISELRSDFDQKRLEHRMEMRAIAPEIGQGYGSAGPGYAPRGPRGGGYGPGYCWR
ncbi:MAG: periplasmic heavy metal sensor [Desulfobacterales bacterium]|nr:periplasmic heavy metal sensor [Desulfobacterales bacterium]